MIRADLRTLGNGTTHWECPAKAEATKYGLARTRFFAGTAEVHVRFGRSATRAGPRTSVWRRCSQPVGNIPLACRMNSSSRNTARSRDSAWLTADCVIARRAAARDTLRSSYAASKTGRRLRSMAVKVEHGAYHLCHIFSLVNVLRAP
jgi:hypothetical protein